MDPQLVFSRVARCVLLDADTFEEIRNSSGETFSGVMVVIVASYLAGLGGLIWTFTAADFTDHFRFFARSFVVGSAIQVLVFFLWVLITSLVLGRMFHIPARFVDLLRVMSFAFAPVALQAMIFVPALDQPIGIISLGAALYVASYAVQVSTMATPGQAFISCLAGFAVFCFILGILGNGAIDLAPGIFALDPNSLSVGLTLPLPSVGR